MTFVLIGILSLPILLLIFLNLFPNAGLKNKWLFTAPIYCVSALSYILLLSRIIQPNPNFYREIIFKWLPINTSYLQLSFSINNQILILFAAFSTIFALKTLFNHKDGSNLSSDKSHLSTIHQNNITYGFFISGLVLLFSNSLLLFFVSQLILSGAIVYQHVYFISNSDRSSKGSLYFIWLIVFDLLFFLAILCINSELKSLSITDIQRAIQNGGFSSNIQKFSGFLIILSIIGKTAQIPFHKWFIADTQSQQLTPISNFSVEIIIISMILLLKLESLLSPNMMSFLLFFGFLSSILAVLSSIVNTQKSLTLKYLLITQSGIFLIVFGSGLASASLVFIITFGFANIFLMFCSQCLQTDNSLSNSVRPIMKKTLTWVFLFAAFSVTGLPLTSVFIPRFILLQNLLFKAATNSLYWIYVVLFALLTCALSFSVFRYFHRRLEKSKTNQQSISTNQMFVFILLIILNIFFIYSLPNYNPLHTGSWLDKILPQSLLPSAFAGNIQVIAGGIILLMTLIGLFIAVFIYRFNIINSNSLRKRFQPIEYSVFSIININESAVSKVSSIMERVTNYIQNIEYLMFHKSVGRFSKLINNFTKMVVQTNSFFRFNMIEKQALTKYLMSINQTIRQKEILIPLIVIIIFLIIFLISVL